jgi:hypothetical protein
MRHRLNDIFIHRIHTRSLFPKKQIHNHKYSIINNKHMLSKQLYCAIPLKISVDSGKMFNSLFTSIFLFFQMRPKYVLVAKNHKIIQLQKECATELGINTVGLIEW